MKIKNTKVMNFDGAFRGLRNPKNSWNRSDSFFGLISPEYEKSSKDIEIAKKWVESINPMQSDNSEENTQILSIYNQWLLKNGIINKNEDENCYEVAYIGPNDMKLAQTLIRAGAEHRKFLRQIFISADITSSIFHWKEMDTYKIGTTANSTSTMHKLATTPITIDCFEIDDYHKDLEIYDTTIENKTNEIVSFCEELRQKYLETSDVRYWKELIRWLPESWLQTRTWTANYEVLYNIIYQRSYHKLETEWGKGFIHWCTTLPYAKELIFFGNEQREKIYNSYA